MIENSYLLILILIPLILLFLMLFISAVYQIKTINRLLQNTDYLEMLSKKEVILKVKPIVFSKILPWIYGFILILIGASCLWANWTTSDFWGVFLIIVGYQTTLWALGIRSSFLGNNFEPEEN